METAFLKNSFNFSMISLSFCKTSSATSLILAPQFLVSEKNGFTVFQNSLLSVTRDGFSPLKNLFFLSYKVYCNNFSAFCRL